MLIVFICIFALGLISLGLFGILIWSKSWPAVKGNLIQAERDLVSVNGREYYQINANYSFEVDGKIYSSKTIMFLGGGLHKNKTAAFKLLDSINTKELKVHYCSLYPIWSYLLPNKVATIMMAVFALIAFCSVFVFCILPASNL